MRNKQELKLFEEAVRILIEGYGRRCVKNEKDWDKDCIACQAQKAIDFLKKHIDLIKWDLRNK